MAEMEWIADPDPVTDGDMLAQSGRVVVGAIAKSGSGRWRWELASLPGDGGYRDDRRGWQDSMLGAKRMVEIRWEEWLIRAGLLPSPPKE